MDKYRLVKYEKGKIVLEDAKNSEDYFYIISRGKVIAYNNFYDKTYSYRKGDIVGLISSITKEPYYSTIETIEDTELWEIKTEYIDKINNKHLINKISDYLYLILEIWLSKYYAAVIKNKTDLYNKEDPLTMAQIYKDAGFTEASHKICSDYIKLFSKDYNTEHVMNFMKDLKRVKQPVHINKNSYKMYKGHCLYSELEADEYVYYIRSGRVGIYNIMDSKYSLRTIFPKEYIIDAHKPTLEYTPLFTTAIVLEDSIIDVMTKEELIKILYDDSNMRLKIIKMISIRVISTILKLKSIKKTNLEERLIVLIYSILKIETLFYEKDYIKLYYKIEDIKNMIHDDADINNIENAIKNIDYIEFDSFNKIIITDIKEYLKKYKSYTE